MKAIEQASTITQPAGAAATPAQLAAVPATHSQKPSKYCAICTPARKLCLNEYPIPIRSDWSEDSEDEKEFQEQSKDKNYLSKFIDWDGYLQQQNNNDNQTPKSSPKSTSTPETLTPSPSNPLRTDLAIKLLCPLVCHQRKDRKKKTFEELLEEID